MIVRAVMLPQDDGNFHQAFDAGGKLVEDLEQIRAVVELPQPPEIDAGRCASPFAKAPST